MAFLHFKPYTPAESNLPVIFWVIQIALLFTWIPMDVWCRIRNHEYMTTEFKEALKRPLSGAIIAFLMCGAVGAFVWHMYNTRDGG